MGACVCVRAHTGPAACVGDWGYVLAKLVSNKFTNLSRRVLTTWGRGLSVA